MADAVATGRVRIALVYGDPAGVEHLREALAERFDIVYAGGAAELDAARLEASHAAAVLVSIDGGDWLEPLADRLAAAGVPLVLDDPAISRKLDGWGRARWLRHLGAKLAGSGDYDPPRPVPESDAAVAQDVAAQPQAAGEITSTAARRVDVPDATAAGAGAAAALAKGKEKNMVESLDGAPTGAPVAKDGNRRAQDPGGVAPATEGDAAGDGGESAAGLAMDPDMAALSAMIDSQLAEPADRPAADTIGVWRVADGEVAASAGTAKPDGPADAADAGSDAASDAPGRAHPVSDPVAEAEVLKGLPSVDSWQLVDPGTDEPPAPKPAPDSEPVAKSIDIAGLELVPMEESGAVERHSDPIERWMDTAERVAAEAMRKRHAGRGGGKA